MSKLPHEALRRLEIEVRSGRAVFFIGSGMSVDSERNDAKRLILRLLIRLRCLSLCARRLENGNRIHRAAKCIEEDFRLNFETGLSGPKTAGLVARNYYEFNDWACTTFSLYLEEIRKLPQKRRERFLDELTRLESGMVGKASIPESIPLLPLGLKFLDQAAKCPLAGAKALFLDTMGFRKPASTMGGDPEAPTYRLLHDSYHRRLFPRHFIWARFAREGWAPLILTTNFDRLIEGAFRLSGFRPENCPLATTIPIPLSRWATISEPEQFFDRGGQGRSATVVKIHGCARQYEKLSSSAIPERYLRSMVFTYREIQNWRADSWSRDYFRSILRTRTMVFAGYSTRDPVIHDTLRSVYEEMRDQRGASPARGIHPASKAPAYFISGARTKGREFHPTEILRAASAAASGQAPSRQESHPNYIGHEFLGSGFPSPDDVMRWLNHLCYRQTQLECLRAEIKHVLGSTGIIIPSNFVDLVCNEFSELVEAETKEAEGFSKEIHVRDLERLCSWTYTFHPQLLREFALADAAVRETGPGHWFTEMREFPDYYFPATARPAWTAWGAFIELTIRRVVKQNHLTGGVRPIAARHPTLILQRSGCRLGHAMEIRHMDMGKKTAIALRRGSYLTAMAWEIPATSCPWQFPPRRTTASASSPPALRRGSQQRMKSPESKDMLDLFRNKPTSEFQAWLAGI